MDFRKLISFIAILLLFNFYLNGVDGAYFAIPIIVSSIFLLHILSRELPKSTIFHPVPFLSLVLMWSMVAAPFVANGSGYNLALPPKEIEWLPWHILTSFIYMFCIIFYCLGVNLGLKVNCHVRPRVKAKSNRVHTISIMFLTISLMMQVFVFIKFGGITGYMNIWSNAREQFQGMGMFLLVAEAFPILFAFYILLNIKSDRKAFAFFVVLIVFFFLLKLMFGGFRGSRSNTIWGLFWLAGVIHIIFYRFKKSHFIAGALFIVSFMSLYSVYKSFGVDAFSGNYSVSDTGRYEGNTSLGVLLTDFSRAGEHAFILHEYFDRNDYDIKLGHTYVSSLFKLIPGVDSPFGFSDKNSAGAELFYGMRINPEFSYYYNSRIYGLYGEGLLNFGVLIPIFLFTIVGVIVGIFQKYFRIMNFDNPLLFMAPFVSNLLLMLILADSDNIVFFVFKNGFFIFLYIILISRSSTFYEVRGGV